jgi:hypothetical protein
MKQIFTIFGLLTAVSAASANDVPPATHPLRSVVTAEERLDLICSQAKKLQDEMKHRKIDQATNNTLAVINSTACLKPNR